MMSSSWGFRNILCMLIVMLAGVSGRAQGPDGGAASALPAAAAAAQGSDSSEKTEQAANNQSSASSPAVPNPFKPVGSLEAPATGEKAAGSEAGSAGNSKSKMPVTRGSYYVYPRNYAKTYRRNYYRPPVYYGGGYPRGYRVPSGWVDPNLGNGGVNFGNGLLNYGNSWLNYGNSY